jgi:hypothetical protein
MTEYGQQVEGAATSCTPAAVSSLPTTTHKSKNIHHSIKEESGPPEDIKLEPDVHISSSMKSFRHFTDLPGELQDHIWFHALPEARVIELALVHFQAPIEGDITRLERLIDIINTKPPAILHTCHNSRRVARLFFEQCKPIPFKTENDLSLFSLYL